MEAEQKANELRAKFDVMINDYLHPHDKEKLMKAGKQCALICVDEILKELEDIERSFDGMENMNLSAFSAIEYHKEYWQEVKTILKK